MDTLVSQEIRTMPVSNVAPMDVVPEFQMTPPECTLEMPVQNLARPYDGSVDSALKTRGKLESRLRRFGVFATAFIATSGLLYEALVSFSVGGLSIYEVGIAFLFAVNFFWIALAAINALIGFVRSRLPTRNNKQNVQAVPKLKVVLLIPAYNEQPERVFANACAMIESVNATSSDHEYALFILSDTTDAKLAAKELDAYTRAKTLLSVGTQFFYRRRPENVGQKAGNIAEWCQRWGASYDAMVVLDADSMMEGETIARLADEMATDPSCGLIQTAPRLIEAKTRFAHLQQFATAAYGPLLASGLDFWFAGEGNYWGHNAIIRTRAFAGCAGLPQLSGRGPMSGGIMSHDFVEAALLRRAGWRIRIMPALEGSYEETPPTLVDHVARDQRWCQGNLQHARVVTAVGLHPLSRFHLFHGIMAYLAAPLWFAFIALGLFTTMDPPASIFAVGQWPSFARSMTWNTSVGPMAALFGTTVIVLLLPKFLGYVDHLLNRQALPSWGGRVRFTLSTVIEVILSAAIAPVMMIQQTLAVMRTLLGLGKGWESQRRVASKDSLRGTLRFHSLETIVGIGLAIGMAAGSVTLWLVPVVIGLLSAVPLSLFLNGKPTPRAGWFGIMKTPTCYARPAIATASLILERQFESDVFTLSTDVDPQGAEDAKTLAPGFDFASV